MAVDDGKDVAVATTMLMAVDKVTIMDAAVVINPILAVVEAEAVVSPLNHKTRPNLCAIGVEWVTIGLKHVGLPNILLTFTKRV